jgi:ATP-binding cassette subfamily C protein LapB
MLLAKPKIWLLDEPTGAMDAGAEARVVSLLGDAAARGATLVVATHKSALLPLLDRLVVLHGGRVILDGPRDQVLAKLAGKPLAVEQGGVSA